ncbi:hypothetical protein FRB96_002523 [Tulasnella sp. 330]|nr:hypothetical protein FRB96_002523 [Tulasnella sp. 330]KAG8876949.1 hypothetical protein FRB97_003793 [Tulasnella sp. 331]KAG8885731.1 hypothetical protein FRB98_001643 [Tulasnella sp. 332]
MNASAIDPVAASQRELLLVDGSETGQVNPLQPVIQPERALDFIVVSYGSYAELRYAPRITCERLDERDQLLQQLFFCQATGLPFPTIPAVVTMLSLNYTSQPNIPSDHPRHYKCNEPDVSLILFLADFPYTAYTNISALLFIIINDQVEQLTSNALSLLTEADGT